MEVKSIVVCGVGGQGIILASDILSSVLFEAGFDVKKNEIHGMSQREGSVLSFIRYGKEVHSPVVPDGSADYLLSFEQLEALRNIRYLKKGGAAVVNSQEIPPTPVQLGLASYPKDIAASFGSVTKDFKLVNAMEAAREAGNAKAVNVILLGVLSNYMKNIAVPVWEKSIRENVKEAFIELNLKAFEIGRKL